MNQRTSVFTHQDECFVVKKGLQRRKEGFTFDIAASQHNYYRNRYKDVLPYDQTRVLLTTMPDSDYINANYINVCVFLFSVENLSFDFVLFCFHFLQMPITSTDTVNRYIATQGPLPTTCEAFWTMVWEQKCSLLIMLTTLFEK